MMDEREEFDDPELKAAIRLARGDHKVRPDLRESVVRRLAELRAQELPKTVSKPAGARMRNLQINPWLAVAALFAVTVGGVAFYSYLQREPEHQQPTYETSNQALLSAMVKLHAAGISGDVTGHPLNASLANPIEIATEARHTVGPGMPNVDLSAEGWKLDAAGLCTLANYSAARFHYTRNGAAITLISVSYPTYGDASNSHYELMIDGHPIAGYVKNGNLNCIVSDPSMPLNDVVALRNRVKGS